MKYNITYDEDECSDVYEILDRILTSTVMSDEDKEFITRLAFFLKDATVMKIINGDED